MGKKWKKETTAYSQKLITVYIYIYSLYTIHIYCKGQHKSLSKVKMPLCCKCGLPANSDLLFSQTSPIGRDFLTDVDEQGFSSWSCALLRFPRQKKSVVDGLKRLIFWGSYCFLLTLGAADRQDAALPVL